MTAVHKRHSFPRSPPVMNWVTNDVTASTDGLTLAEELILWVEPWLRPFYYLLTCQMQHYFYDITQIFKVP